jgi:hypothetical protein
MYMRISKILLLASLFLAAAVLRVSASDTDQETYVLTAVKAQGPVAIFSAEKNSWQDMTIPCTIRANDIVRTQGGGSCEISFGASSVKINENSEVTFASMVKLIELSMSHGDLLIKLKSLAGKSDFTVKTPQGTTGARGTKYEVLVLKDRPVTAVRVLESSVDLRSKDEANKYVLIKECEEREISPWDKAIITARGSGILSKAILEKEVVSAASSGPPVEMTDDEYGKKFGALARVTTKRAAVTDCYRKLAEKIYGVVIDSSTTVENFAVKDDTIRTTVQGIVRGARETSSQYFSDGSVRVTMETAGARVKEDLTPLAGNIFGSDCIPGAEILTPADFDEFLR